MEKVGVWKDVEAARVAVGQRECWRPIPRSLGAGHPAIMLGVARTSSVRGRVPALSLTGRMAGFVCLQNEGDDAGGRES